MPDAFISSLSWAKFTEKNFPDELNLANSSLGNLGTIGIIKTEMDPQKDPDYINKLKDKRLKEFGIEEDSELYKSSEKQVTKELSLALLEFRGESILEILNDIKMDGNNETYSLKDIDFVHNGDLVKIISLINKNLRPKSYKRPWRQEIFAGNILEDREICSRNQLPRSEFERASFSAFLPEVIAREGNVFPAKQRRIYPSSLMMLDFSGNEDHSADYKS